MKAGGWLPIDRMIALLLAWFASAGAVLADDLYDAFARRPPAANGDRQETPPNENRSNKHQSKSPLSTAENPAPPSSDKAFTDKKARRGDLAALYGGAGLILRSPEPRLPNVEPSVIEPSMVTAASTEARHASCEQELTALDEVIEVGVIEQPAAAPQSIVLTAAAGDALPALFSAGDQPNRNESTRKTTPRRAPPVLMSIRETSIDLTPVPRIFDEDEAGEPSSVRPEDLAGGRFGPYDEALVGGNEVMRFAAVHYLWYSPAMRHKPLYFEQPNIERYGTHLGGTCLASTVATAKFVGSALSLPYQLGAHPPRECVYTLGVYRPGNCTPHFFHVSPLSGKGLLCQTAAVSGLVFLFP